MITKLNLAKRSGIILKAASALPILLAVAVVTITLAPSKVSAAPQTFTVTSTSASGAGSLAQAISNANSNGNPLDKDVINFNIPGAGDQIITPSSQLQITQSVLINGYTQSDAAQNTNFAKNDLNSLIRIEINLIQTGSLLVSADNVTLRGLAVNNTVEEDIIQVVNADNFELFGNYIGTAANGLNGSGGYNSGLRASVSILGSSSARIGSSQPADRNVLGYCSESCIFASAYNGQDSPNLTVQGNNIGVGADSITRLEYLEPITSVAMAVGVSLREGADYAVIGGQTEEEGNIISALSRGGIDAQDVEGLGIYANHIMRNSNASSVIPSIASGIRLAGVINTSIGSPVGQARNIFSHNFNSPSISIINSLTSSQVSENIEISGNYFGVAYDGQTALGNDKGIDIGGDSHDINVTLNVIANTYRGVIVRENANDISILSNSMHSNFEPSIDNGADWYTTYANDTGDVDVGSNDLLNHPEWFKVTEDAGDTEVEFAADLPIGDYRIEFFSNPFQASPYDMNKGETYVGSTTITGTGEKANFSHLLTGVTNLENLTMTATEIEPSSPFGFGATSEFGGQGSSVGTHDLTLTKAILDPQNYSQGGTVQYALTLTNTGDNSIDLTQFDGGGGNPLATGLVNDYLPDGLTFNSVISGDASCLAAGQLGVISPGLSFANHAGHTIVLCSYSGSNTDFDPGEELEIVISADIASDFELTTPNLATPGQLPGDPGANRWADCFTYVYSEDNSAGADVLDCLMPSPGGPPTDLTFNSTPSGDLSISKTLDNPEDFVAGGTVEYTVTLSNSGDAPIDLTSFDGSGMNPFNANLFIDYLPPDMVFSGSTGDISCASFGSLSGAGALFNNHPDYQGVFCAYTGSDTNLEPGGEVSFTISATLDAESELNYTNYVTAAPLASSPGEMATATCFTAAVETNGIPADVIDCLLLDTSGVADIAYAGAPTNIEVSKELKAPNGLSPGSQVSYDVSFTNNGPGSVDLAWYSDPNSQKVLLADVFPDADLEITSQTSSQEGVGCLNVGSGTAPALGPIAADHTDHALLICLYAPQLNGGANPLLAAGESIVITINATVRQGFSSGSVSNYILSPFTPSDSAGSALAQAMANSEEDILDTFPSGGTFFRLASQVSDYGNSSGGGNSGTGNGNGGTNNSSGSQGGLSGTGDKIRTLVVAGIVLTLISTAMLVGTIIRKRRSQTHAKAKL